MEENHEVESKKPGADYVAIVSTLGLCVVSCFSIYYGENVVAGTAVGIIGGYMKRLYDTSWRGDK